MSSDRDENIEPAKRALASIPAFGFVGSARITSLNGLTNRVYRVDAKGGPFCLRIPGEDTEAIIDRRAEEANAPAAADAGVGPEVLYFGEDGVMLTRFIEGAMLSPERFRESDGAIERAANALRRLHDSAAPFVRDFRVFEIMDRYVDLLRKQGVPLRPDARSLAEQAKSIRIALEKRPEPLKPSHCDPTGGNLIDTGERVVLIDWEYSAMNDPAWDLAYLSLEGGFDAALDRRLLVAYFGGAATPAETARVNAHKALCDLLSALWALIQHANGNRRADFRAYAKEAFARCRTRMISERFAKDLLVLAEG